MTQHSSFAQALDALADKGLNWLTFLADSESPQGPLALEAEPQAGLLFFLAMGSRFGDQTDCRVARDGHPFDERSSRIVERFIAEHCAGVGAEPELVYPPVSPVDMRAWLEAGRVQYRSRIGIGIRPDCGTWLAVRAIARVRLQTDQHRELLRRYPPLGDEPSPCDSCEGHPCVAACPSAAVQVLPDEDKLLRRCVEHRLKDGSGCASLCHARLACPVGQRSRYSERQLRFHYSRSLKVLRAWKSGERILR